MNVTVDRAALRAGLKFASECFVAADNYDTRWPTVADITALRELASAVGMHPRRVTPSDMVCKFESHRFKRITDAKRADERRIHQRGGSKLAYPNLYWCTRCGVGAVNYDGTSPPVDPDAPRQLVAAPSTTPAEAGA